MQRIHDKHWPFGHLDCQENPYDLRPMVRRIMEAESFILDRLPRDVPLVIIIGEHHESQGHALLQKAVLIAHAALRGKSEAGNFAFGYEAAHDYAHKFSGSPIADPHGSQAINLRRRFHAGSARKAHQDLLDYCVDAKISVSFNDVSCDHGRIDYRDPLSRAIVKEYNPTLLQKTPPERGADYRGLAISNLCMAEKAMHHIERTQARVYIQQCGQSHVFGDINERYRFEESLSIRFLERGAEILPVICNYEIAQDYIPEQAEALFDQSVILSYNDMAPDAIPFEDVRIGIGRQSGLNL